MDISTAMRLMVLVFCVLNLAGHGGAELDFVGEPLQNRTARLTTCLENHEYFHNGFCCKNCEAGTYVSEKCMRDQEKGTCSPCKAGTYAEHPTGMEQCLQCSHCHLDQNVIAECTSMSNTKCECKAGSYCLPDEPCEVCKKCVRCKADEEEASACTATSNTKCKKRTSNPTEGPQNQSTDKTGTIVSVVFSLVLLLLAAFCIYLYMKHRRRQSETDAGLKEVKVPIDDVYPQSEEEQENSHNAGLERTEEERPDSQPLLTQESQETSETSETGKSIPVEDEDRGLGDSLPNTTSSSQTSLPALSPAIEDSPRSSPPSQRQTETETETEPWAQDDGLLRKLVPVLGEEESLSKSFDLFDTLDVRIHNKFFRSIGVSDNAIKMAETQHLEDKVYNLLRVWMQKEGLQADINTLLQSLLDLNQRYSAEQISSKAVEKRFYRYES